MKHEQHLWPRAGGDVGNRSRTALRGPTQGVVLRRAHIPGILARHPKARRRTAGGAVAGDGTLRLINQGLLYAMARDGVVLWSANVLAATQEARARAVARGQEHLAGHDPRDHLQAYYSQPTLLSKGRTLLTLSGSAAIFDARGRLVAWTDLPLADDSGLAPNVDLEGTPVFTTIDGSVYLWKGERLADVGTFGYDVPPVAVFADNSLAVAGYSYKGFCRVRRDGTLVWRTELEDADLLPTISLRQVSAVGSLNDGCSMFFARDGVALGSYGHPALFAEYLDGGWVAQSKQLLARLSESGGCVWAHRLESPTRWSQHQPLVDATGRIYAAGAGALLAFDGEGRTIFELRLRDEPGPLFPLAEGILGTIVGDELLSIG